MWFIYMLIIAWVLYIPYSIVRFLKCRKAKKEGVCFHWHIDSLSCIGCRCKRQFTAEERKRIKAKIDELY